MLKSYFKIVIRSLIKGKTFSLINIAGLALGISCFTIIMVYVENELSYDRFHHNPENIVRVVKDFVNEDGSSIPDATTPPALARAIREELPEAEHVTRFFPNWGRRNLVEYGEKRFYELNLLRIDSTFFNVFDFEFIHGSKENPFNGIHSIILTESTAKKYFGNENPVGKILNTNINNKTPFLVSAVLKDVPHNSHFTFDMLIPFESGRDPDKDWGWYSFYTYVRLKQSAEIQAFEKKVIDLFRKHKPDNQNRFYTQQLTDIHLKSSLKWELGENGNLDNVRIISAIGIFVLVIASINFVNLVTAQSGKRAKEVGIRKVTGAAKHSLVRQFLFESLFIVVISSIISVIITTLVLPLGNQLVGGDLSTLFSESHFVRTVLPLCILIIGLLAGIYPAIYLSSFQPIKVLRGSFFGSASGIRLRQGLVVFQFTMSSLLIVGFLIIQRQLGFISNKDIGFDHENIVLVPNVIGAGNPQAIAEEFRKVPSVKGVARASGIIGFRNAMTGVADKLERNHIALNFILADYDFIPTLNVDVVDGRNFSVEFPSDSSAIIINETAVAQLGLKEPVIGQQLKRDDQQGNTHDVTIVGVVRDFHFSSFHEEIKPFAFILEYDNGSTFFLKIQQGNIQETIAEIEKAWRKHNPDKPFEYAFQDEHMQRLHVAERKFKVLFSSFTALAIVIACLGLFGLVTVLAESKTKEIGIRKILGSSVMGIIGLISKDFIKLVLIALLLASPVAYYAGDNWLDGFAYRIDIDWKVFAAAGAATLAIAFGTICLRSLKAATANPVKSLKEE
ncbi:MAG TPA: ABC transporter permease [Chryseolinea sp.]|nr:ABC transporter permease [Chryseolinea sp.]